jgi:hypothetical protein
VKLITFALILLTHCLAAQTFSGQVVYVRKIIPINQKINVDSILSDGLGDSSVYAIMGQSYKSTFYRKGKLVFTYIYCHPDFKFYFLRPETDYVSYDDSRRNVKPIKSMKIHRDSTSTLLGFPVFIAYKNYSDHKEEAYYRSYYSDSIRIDPETFKGHAASGWYNELKATKGCFNLKTEQYNKDFIEIYEAVKITKGNVDPSTFALPYGKLLVASPAVVDKKAKLIQTNDAQICHGETVNQIPDVPEKSETITIYIIAVVSDKGELLSVTSWNKDEYGISSTAVDIIQNCGYRFIPAEIKGKPVTSECIIPMQFRI